MSSASKSMGKLHKIRKAIEANPKEFTGLFGYAYGACFREATLRGWNYDGKARADVTPSYRAYVRFTLRKLGYRIKNDFGVA